MATDSHNDCSPIKMRVSETALVDACLRYLRCVGAMAWRNNSGLMQVHTPGRRSRYVRFGGIVGAPDILGIAPTGLALCIECKRPGNKPALAQQAFLDEAMQHKALAMVVTDVQQLVDTWEALFPRDLESLAGG